MNPHQMKDPESTARCILWRRHRPRGLSQGGLEGQRESEDKGVQRRHLQRSHRSLQGEFEYVYSDRNIYLLCVL